ncbi:MAG: hypothetical protein IJR89_00035 [Clostridia bacterium]|nr:hypothetical protein [Clostridia bacterium]
MGLTVFGMMLTFATAEAGAGLFLAASVFSVLFYLALIYSTVSEVGYKHAEKIASGRMRLSKPFGLRLCLAAYIPNFLVLILMWIGVIFGASYTWAGNLGGIANTVIHVIFSMYWGIEKTLNPAETATLLLSAVIYTAAMLPGLLVSALAYALGRRGISLLSKPDKKEF